jgi:hypothetical protein
MTAARRAAVHRKISFTAALRSKQLFEPYFAGPSWARWRAVLKAAFAESLDASELAAFLEVAARDPPTRRVKELVAVIGRGGGKNSATSALAAFISITFDPRAAKLRPGEVVYIICIAKDKEQAALEYRMLSGLFEAIPVLRAMVKGKIGSDSIELKNRVIIEVKTNSYRSIRGRGILAAIFDECSFYRDERSQNPDVELHAAVSPGLARVPGSMMILISSAHRRAGLLYERWKTYYHKPDDNVLVVHGSIVQFNPSFDQKVIDKDLASDYARFSAEYLSEWRDDISSFIPRELLEACTETGVSVRPPQTGVIYHAFADTSSGRNDSFTMSIAHREQYGGGTRVVVDLLYERVPPFSPTAAVEEITTLLRQYRCSVVTGDAYAIGFVIDAFRKAQIEYRKSQLDRSEIYLGFLPLLTSGQVLLLDHLRALGQFAGLVRKTFPLSGRDRVDHELPNSHDDLSNAIAGAAVLASAQEQIIPIIAPIIIGKSQPPAPGTSTTQAFYDWTNSYGPWWGPV